jgi:hypothetical protein
MVARNHDAASANRIHSDEGARAHGFRAGLVPGVDLFAYLCRLPVAEWGLTWLGGGAISAEFRKPVYDGDPVAIDATVAGAEMVEQLAGPAGEVCARAAVWRGPGQPPHPPGLDGMEWRQPDPRRWGAPDPGRWAAPAPPASPPPASPATLAPGTVLGAVREGVDGGRVAAYLAAVGDTAPLYRDTKVAHPGWVLRLANRILMANVGLGPWLHVASHVRFFRPVGEGCSLEGRGRVAEEYGRRGHRFVRLEVLVLADGQPAQMVSHLAIYSLRPPVVAE